MLLTLNKKMILKMVVLLLISLSTQANAGDKTLEEMQLETDYNNIRSKHIESELSLKELQFKEELFDIKKRIELEKITNPSGQIESAPRERRAENVGSVTHPMPSPARVNKKQSNIVVTFIGGPEGDLSAKLLFDNKDISVITGEELPNGEVVVKIKPREITLLDQQGNKRKIKFVRHLKR